MATSGSAACQCITTTGTEWQIYADGYPLVEGTDYMAAGHYGR
jgi:hypothetical protein